jgi:hypothetical protein
MTLPVGFDGGKSGFCVEDRIQQEELIGRCAPSQDVHRHSPSNVLGEENYGSGGYQAVGTKNLGRWENCGSLAGLPDGSLRKACKGN